MISERYLFDFDLRRDENVWSESAINILGVAYSLDRGCLDENVWRKIFFPPFPFSGLLIYE